jgi:predicted phage terminase large subunit-like protein
MPRRSISKSPKTTATKKPVHRNIEVKLSDPQRTFLLSKQKFSAFVGGIGSGKSWVGVLKVLAMPGKSRGMIIAPTYKVLMDATLATFWSVIDHSFGDREDFVAEFNKSEMRMVLKNGTEILLRSAENPDNLRGPSLDWIYLDEAAYISEDVWDVAIGRLRGPVGPHQAWITTTPNGRRTSWIWRTFADDPDPDLYEMVHAPTSSNKFVPESYLQSTAKKYSSRQAAQELEGQFLDVEGSRVPAEWVRRTHHAPDGRVVVGVDLAISTRERADYTAMVAVVDCKTPYVCGASRHKLPFEQSMNEIVRWCLRVGAREVRVEAVAYQMSAVQTLQSRLREHGIVVRAVRPQGDKLSRFLPVEAMIESGLLTFSPAIPEEFFDELCGFTGKNDPHDDYVDALVYACGIGAKRKGGFVDASSVFN